MKLPAILAGVPKIVLILAVPAVAFAAAVGISLGTDSGDGQKASAVPTVAVAVTNRQPLANTLAQQPSQAESPAPAPLPDRTDCNAIRGSDYRSAAEQEWFKKTCGAGSTTTTASTGSAGTGGTTTTTQSTAPRQAVSGAQVPSGQRLIIPAAGVNANIDITKMGGYDMPDPVGYWNALTYDMSDLPGLGNKGVPGSGNMVVSGHVDCGKCNNGGPGVAVFWSTRNLQPGDTAQVVDASGKTRNYVVTRSQAVTGSADWNAILASGAADLTVITCTGTFNAATHEYDQRHYVWFKEA